jgi:membrane fusion protein (multidrug efflux system)
VTKAMNTQQIYRKGETSERMSPLPCGMIHRLRPLHSERQIPLDRVFGSCPAAIVCLAFVLSVALLAGCGGGREGPAAESRLVQAVTASLDSLSVNVTAWGKTEASRRVALAFEVPGSIEALPYDEGDPASRGAVLGELRQNRFKANLAQAKATYEEAQRNLKRMTSLSEENVVSDEERERAETDLAAAEAAFRSAEEDLRGSIITAPFKGLVARRHCELGQYVSAGTPAFVFMEMDPILVTVGLSDKDISMIREGQPAIIRLDAYPEREFEGTVREVAVAADESGGSFPVEVELPNPDLLFKAGMAAEVAIAVQKVAGAVILPMEAIVYDGLEPYVFLVSDSVATKRKIQVRAQSEMRVAVLGISAGDTVVAAGNRFLRDGEPIRYTLKRAGESAGAE